MARFERRCRRSPSRIILAVALAAFGACDAGGDAPPEEVAPVAEVTPDAVRYRLEWVLDGVEVHPDHWVVTNDLGIRFEIDAAWLVDYSVSLVPCVDDTAEAVDATEGVAGSMAATGELGPQDASGHGEISDDSGIPAPLVESLVPLQTLETEFIELPIPTRYCHAHYLLARATEEASGLPEDADAPDMERQTLALRGGWTREGNAELHTLDLTTNLADGTLLEMPLNTITTSGITVVVQRDLGTFFDGIDPEAVTDAQFAQKLLENLTDSVSLDVEGEENWP